MNKIVIYRHIECEGPAYLGTLLDKHNIDYELICIDEGKPVVSNLNNTAGLIFMGGSMSVNDDYDWIGHEIALIKQAIKNDVPVLGICFGSQLMAKALGSTVSPGPCMELGWLDITKQTDNSWTENLASQFPVFHWHGETFAIPDGATQLYSSELCANQAFSIGPHLALQFHMEMHAETVRSWLDLYPEDIERRCLAEHDKQSMLAHLDDRIGALQNVATVLFEKWLHGCKFN